MLIHLLKNKALNAKIRECFKKHEKEILDIILFGSVVRGKEKPKDIDILILFKERENLEIAYQIRKEVEQLHIQASITTKTYTSLMAKSFPAREAYLSEGYSLVYARGIAEGLGYATYTLFKYELKGFTPSRRTQFHYSLQGRSKKEGMSKELRLIKFANTILLSPMENTERTRAYLEYWNIKFEEAPILLPARFIA